MILEQGRPVNNDGRLDKEIRTYDFLDSLGVSYERIEHEPAMTMEACEEIDRILGATICKNLLLCNRQQTDFYLLMMPGDKVYKTKDFSPLVGSSRLSFADEADMIKYLDVTPGSVSIMGLINDKDKVVHLAIDEDVLKPDFVGCHPCINTSSLKIKKTDLLEKYLPAVGYTPQIVSLPRYENERV